MLGGKCVALEPEEFDAKTRYSGREGKREKARCEPFSGPRVGIDMTRASRGPSGYRRRGEVTHNRIVGWQSTQHHSLRLKVVRGGGPKEPRKELPAMGEQVLRDRNGNLLGRLRERPDGNWNFGTGMETSKGPTTRRAMKHETGTGTWSRVETW